VNCPQSARLSLHNYIRLYIYIKFYIIISVGCQPDRTIIRRWKGFMALVIARTDYQ
jgi:hypothetical protein